MKEKKNQIVKENMKHSEQLLSVLTPTMTFLPSVFFLWTKAENHSNEPTESHGLTMNFGKSNK